MHLKISKKSKGSRVSFLVKFLVKDCNFIKKRLQHSCFPGKFGKYGKFILQNTSGGINKKRSKVHRQRVLLKIIYYYTTGWLLNEAFNVSLWNKTKNSSWKHCLCHFGAKSCRLWLYLFEVILIECVRRIFLCFSHSVLCKVG